MKPHPARHSSSAPSDEERRNIFLRCQPYLKAFVIVGIFFCALAHAADANEQTLCTLDLSPTKKIDASNPEQVRRAWDEAHCMAALQGIVNRTRPRFYLFFVGGPQGETDRFWLDRLRQPEGWLAHYSLEALPDAAAAVRHFRSEIKGVVLYDEQVPATSNVASTVAGVEDLLPVRYDPDPHSLCHALTIDPEGPRLPVKLRFVDEQGASLFTGKGTIPGTKTPSTLSAKCDAYLWAKERYLDTGRCNPTCFGYYLDSYWLKKPGGDVSNHTLTNHDYVISKRGFFFDLSPWDDEAATDDPSQPVGTDARTLQAILRSAYDRTQGQHMIHLSGFLPWNLKYTQRVGGKHGDVQGEWRYAEMVSCFNGYMDADALGLSAMANASLYRLFPLAKHYPQRRPTVEDLKTRGFIGPDGKPVPRQFISFYVGDYDSAAWFYRHMPDFWNDPARGSIPLGWAFNPNLADRAGPMMDWVRRTATDHDFFMSGDSGAGYINPGSLQEPRKFSGLKSGLSVWAAHCKRYYTQWDITATGFIIDGDSPGMDAATKDAYASFSPDGFVAQKIAPHGLWHQTPFLRMSSDLYRPIEKAAEVVLKDVPNEKPSFHLYRTILWAPDDHKKLFDLLKSKNPEIEIVDPYTLFLLVKLHENEAR